MRASNLPQGASPGRFRSGQAGTHPYEARGLDRYSTPRIAIESLLNAEPDVLNTTARIWEPAAGDGNIVQVIRDNGIPVIASDVERRDFDLHFVGDFLQQERVWPRGLSSLWSRRGTHQIAKPPGCRFHGAWNGPSQNLAMTWRLSS
jgi:hypothetical protein